MHIVGLQSTNTHKKEVTDTFYQVNTLDEEVAEE